jgi:Family of unknown function (DUF6932)
MGEAEFARLTLEEIRQQYGESTPRRQFLFRRLHTVTRLLSETGSLRHLYLFGSFTAAKPTPGDLDCLAVMAAGFTTVNLPAHLLNVFQHDLCRLYYHADVFWVTEGLGREHIEAMLAVFSHDRHGAFQPIVEVTV